MEFIFLLTIKRMLKHFLAQVFVYLLLTVEPSPIRLREKEK